MYLNYFEGAVFEDLARQHVRVQRPLWASTSTKNPEYLDIKYVEELIGPHTVNTVPQKTLDAYRDHGDPKIRITENLDEAQSALAQLEQLGISMKQVTDELEQEGVSAFSKSFVELRDNIEARQKALVQRAQ
jgi:transaldolase